MPLLRQNDWEREYGGWETWECPTCGAQQGFGPGGKAAIVPKCQFGHKPVEMEQKFASAMPRELLKQAETNPHIRIDLGEST